MNTEFPPGVELVEKSGGYPILQIHREWGSARIALHGAHLFSWIPANEEEVLYLSPSAIYREGIAIRGGIPICWPWFHKHPTSPDLPSHGFARDRFWNLKSVLETRDGIAVEMTLEIEGWRATIEFTIGETLGISLVSKNTRNEKQMLAGALHTYFKIDAIGATSVHGLDQIAYVDKTDSRAQRVQDGALRFRGETDSIYETEGETVIRDQSKGRSVHITKSGSPSTVVWNPWIERVKDLEDLPNDDYTKFVCVETAISNESAIALAPGESHTLATTVRVTRP